MVFFLKRKHVHKKMSEQVTTPRGQPISASRTAALGQHAPSRDNTRPKLNGTNTGGSVRKKLVFE